MFEISKQQVLNCLSLRQEDLKKQDDKLAKRVTADLSEPEFRAHIDQRNYFIKLINEYHSVMKDFKDG